MTVTSADIAASLEAQAKEIAAAAAVYPRLPDDRDALAAGLGAMLDALNENFRIFTRKRAQEAARAQA
jgi:plasmid stability protein